jgi:hypothetical protein
MSMSCLIVALGSLLAMVGPTCAQFVMPPYYSGERKIPIIADVTVTVTSDTPWGPYTQTQSGKYWRSRDGATRRDDGFHNSYISGAPGVTWTRSWIDHDAKTVYEIVDHYSLESPFLEPLHDPSGLNSQILMEPRRLVKIGEKKIDGRKATGRRSEGVPKGYPWGPDGDRWSFEVWTANDIKLAILFQYNTRLMQVVQRFENIQEREPDPDVFRIPKGYRVRTAQSGEVKVPPPPGFSEYRIQK